MSAECEKKIAETKAEIKRLNLAYDAKRLEFKKKNTEIEALRQKNIATGLPKEQWPVADYAAIRDWNATGSKDFNAWLKANSTGDLEISLIRMQEGGCPAEAEAAEAEAAEAEAAEAEAADPVIPGAAGNVKATGKVETVNAPAAKDQTATETKRLEYTSEEARVDLNTDGKVENRFYGMDIKDSASLQLLNKQRGKLDKIDGVDMYQVPWDWRFGNAYTNTQSIENSMPKGPEWVGSPSIMNDLALIRFAHVVGNKHHINLLDNEKNQIFRSSGLVRKQVTAMNLETRKGDVDVEIIGKKSNGDDQVAIDQADMKKYGLDPNDKSIKIYKTSSGALYQDVLDPDNKEYRAANSAPVPYKDKIVGLTELAATPPTVPYAAGDQYSPKNIEYWMAYIGNAKYCSGGLGSGGEVFTMGECKDIVDEIKKATDNREQALGAMIDKNDKVLEASIREKFDKDSKAAGDVNIQIRKSIYEQWKRTWEGPFDVYTQKPLMNDEMTTMSDTVVEPTTDNLCNNMNWQGKEQFRYRYADFLYCKFWNKIPNNRMITLRRFPNPTHDNATVFGQDTEGKFVKPVAQAVTWLDEATGNTNEAIMGMTWKMNWREMKSKVEEVQGNEMGAEDSPFPNVAKWLGMSQTLLTGKGFGAASGWDAQRAKFDPYKDGMYANRIYGPVNVIDKTKARERGLEFENTIILKFHYSLASIGGINPKAAMLDILANILALTYNNAGFWGGANRYFPNKPAYPFPGGKKGFESWFKGDFEGFFGAMGAQLNQTMGSLANVLQDLMNNPAAALKTLLGGAGKLWMAEKQRAKRPAILTFKALLTGDPVGEWHLVVGNPFNPTLMIGNLICTGTKVTFSESYGVDDFPEDMTFEVTLEHGRPRDKGDIESMFNKGQGRLHYAPFGQKNMAWNVASSTRDSKIDTSYKPGSVTADGLSTGKDRVDVNGGGTFSGGMFTGYQDSVSGKEITGTLKSWDASVEQAFTLAQKVGQSRGSTLAATK